MRARELSCHVEVSIGAGGLGGIEQQIEEGLLELVTIALKSIGGSFEIASEGNFSALELWLHKPESVVEGFVKPHGGKGRFGGSGEFQNLTDQGIDARNLSFDDSREFGVLVLLQEKFHEGADSDEGIFNLVGDARRKNSDARQPIEPAHVEFEFLQAGNFVQHHHQFLDRLLFAPRNGGVNRQRTRTSIRQRKFQGAVGGRFPRLECFSNDCLQGFGQDGDRFMQQFFLRHFQQLRGGGGDRGDFPLRIDHENSANQAGPNNFGKAEAFNTSSKFCYVERHTRPGKAATFLRHAPHAKNSSSIFLPGQKSSDRLAGGDNIGKLASRHGEKRFRFGSSPVRRQFSIVCLLQ